jgi:hypothetical protein
VNHTNSDRCGQVTKRVRRFVHAAGLSDGCGGYAVTQTTTFKRAARIKRGEIKGVATYSPMLCTPVKSANVKAVQPLNAIL